MEGKIIRATTPSPTTTRSFSAAINDDYDDPLERASSLTELFAANEPSASIRQDRPRKRQCLHHPHLTFNCSLEASSGAARAAAAASTPNATAEYWCKHAVLKQHLPAVLEAFHFYQLFESQLLYQERANNFKSQFPQSAQAAKCVKCVERCIAFLEEDESKNSPQPLSYIGAMEDTIMKFAATRLPQRGFVDTQKNLVEWQMRSNTV